MDRKIQTLFALAGRNFSPHHLGNFFSVYIILDKVRHTERGFDFSYFEENKNLPPLPSPTTTPQQKKKEKKGFFFSNIRENIVHEKNGNQTFEKLEYKWKKNKLFFTKIFPIKHTFRGRFFFHQKRGKYFLFYETFFMPIKNTHSAPIQRFLN